MNRKSFIYFSRKTIPFLPRTTVMAVAFADEIAAGPLWLVKRCMGRVKT